MLEHVCALDSAESLGFCSICALDAPENLGSWSMCALETPRKLRILEHVCGLETQTQAFGACARWKPQKPRDFPHVCTGDLRKSGCLEHTRTKTWKTWELKTDCLHGRRRKTWDLDVCRERESSPENIWILDSSAWKHCKTPDSNTYQIARGQRETVDNEIRCGSGCCMRSQKITETESSQCLNYRES